MSDTGTARRSGLRIGRVLGVPVYVMPSWFVLAALLIVILSPPLIDSNPDMGGSNFGVDDTNSWDDGGGSDAGGGSDWDT